MIIRDRNTEINLLELLDKWQKKVFQITLPFYILDIKKAIATRQKHISTVLKIHVSCQILLLRAWICSTLTTRYTFHLLLFRYRNIPKYLMENVNAKVIKCTYSNDIIKIVIISPLNGTFIAKFGYIYRYVN